MTSLDLGLVVDAVAEQSLETELQTVTETSADCWATRQQIIEYLQASDWSEAEASVGSAERVGLIQRVPGQDAWLPTAAGSVFATMVARQDQRSYERQVMGTTRRLQTPGPVLYSQAMSWQLSIVELQLPCSGEQHGQLQRVTPVPRDPRRADRQRFGPSSCQCPDSPCRK